MQVPAPKALMVQSILDVTMAASWTEELPRLDRPARTDGGLPGARLHAACRGSGRRARRLGAASELKEYSRRAARPGKRAATLRRLFEGRNEAKQLLRVAE